MSLSTECAAALVSFRYPSIHVNTGRTMRSVYLMAHPVFILNEISEIARRKGLGPSQIFKSTGWTSVQWAVFLLAFGLAFSRSFSSLSSSDKSNLSKSFR